MTHAADDLTSARVPAQAGAAESNVDDYVDGDLAQAEAEADDIAEALDKEGLGEQELAMLAFEQQWWKRAGAKEQAIRDTFGLTATRYYQLLNALLDDPAALEHDPVLVQRLRRLRSTRARRRTA
jgi:hypothetical protein